MNICWYSDDEIEIYFNKEPLLNICFAAPWMSQIEVDDINNKPFICNENLNVVLIDRIKEDTYEFVIPKGYTWDGASVPRFFWRLIGSNNDQRFLIPSLIHDFLCENKDCIDNDRYFSTIVFERLLYVSRVNPISRWLIKHSVDNYQKFCGW